MLFLETESSSLATEKMTLTSGSSYPHLPAAGFIGKSNTPGISSKED